MTLYNLTDERIHRFRVALALLADAIEINAPRPIVDKLQASVARYRVPGVVGDAIISAQEFRV